MVCLGIGDDIMTCNYLVRAYRGNDVLCNVRVVRYYIASRIRDSISVFPAVEKIRIFPLDR